MAPLVLADRTDIALMRTLDRRTLPWLGDLLTDPRTPADELPLINLAMRPETHL